MKDLDNAERGSKQGKRDSVGATPGSEIDDVELARALRNFKLSVHAWSDAVIARPRSVEVLSKKHAWRRGAAWALSLGLAVAVAGGGVYEQHQKQERARIAAAREAAHQRQLVEERARETEDLLARVDSDVSREVPNALEPLARLMDDETR